MKPRAPAGFTLVEVLLAVAVLALMGTILFVSFRAIVDTSLRTEEKMDSLHNGEILMEQLVSSLRSAVFFERNAKQYGLWHEDDDDRYPADTLSWVSGTMAFIPPKYPTRQGLHRIYLSMEEEEGERGLAVSAYPHLVDPEDEDVDEIEPWLVSTRVVGFDCRFYDVTKESWEEEWERENQLPLFVEISLFLRAAEEGEEPTRLVRLVNIPAANLSRDSARGRRNSDGAASSGRVAEPATSGGGE